MFDFLNVCLCNLLYCNIFLILAVDQAKIVGFCVTWGPLLNWTEKALFLLGGYKTLLNY